MGKAIKFSPFCHSFTYTASRLRAIFSVHLTTLGLTCLIHQSLFSGWTLVVMPRFDLEKFCSTIQKEKITFAYVVPPIILLLGKHPIVDKYDLSSLRMMNSGAAPLTRELVDQVYKRLKVPIKQGYGLSETSPTTHTQVYHSYDDSMILAKILY